MKKFGISHGDPNSENSGSSDTSTATVPVSSGEQGATASGDGPSSGANDPGPAS